VASILTEHGRVQNVAPDSEHCTRLCGGLDLVGLTPDLSDQLAPFSALTLLVGSSDL